MSSADQATAPDPEFRAPKSKAIPPRMFWLSTTIAAIAAGFLAWLVGETQLVWVVPKQVGQTIFGQAFAAQTADTIKAANVATAVRMYGVFGALLGFALGAVGGFAGRSARSASVAMLIGLGLGAIAGSVMSMVAIPLYHRFHESIPSDLIASMLMHGAVWGAIGASSALALALGLRGRGRFLGLALACGLMSGLLGTALYEVAGAVIFATDETGEPISQSAASRLFARVAVSVCIGIGSVAAFGKRRDSTEPSATP